MATENCDAIQRGGVPHANGLVVGTAHNSRLVELNAHYAVLVTRKGANVVASILKTMSDKSCRQLQTYLPIPCNNVLLGIQILEPHGQIVRLVLHNRLDGKRGKAPPALGAPMTNVLNAHALP